MLKWLCGTTKRRCCRAGCCIEAICGSVGVADGRHNIDITIVGAIVGAGYAGERVLECITHHHVGTILKITVLGVWIVHTLELRGSSGLFGGGEGAWRESDELMKDAGEEAFDEVCDA